MALDIDKIDTNIRHAMGIVDLLMDNIGHRVDSNQDSMEYALWSAKKHLEEAVNAISDDGEERIKKVFSDLDESAFEKNEDEEDEDEVFVVGIGIKKDGTISLVRGEDK